MTEAAVPDLTQITKALAARAEDYDRTASFPAESITAVHEAGLLTATIGATVSTTKVFAAETPMLPAASDCDAWTV